MIKGQLENQEMMAFQDLLETPVLVEILEKMALPDQRAYPARLGLPAIEDLLVLLEQEDFKVCPGLQVNQENLVKMVKLDFLVNLE